eukprot:TRINITY_DN1728_c0_g1_i7.p1 TRINITY_DN1728_c0_g1~~TRINITY_DN1728_c0_g1_i7.p1  ORF type:complete len:306 (+),score=56.14 TRINITY_DN1728_c0_g1_i7:219-1136(+)
MISLTTKVNKTITLGASSLKKSVSALGRLKENTRSALNLGEVKGGYAIGPRTNDDSRVNLTFNHQGDGSATKYSKYRVFWVNCKDNKIVDVLIELPAFCTVLDCIKEVIPYLNEQLRTQGCRFQLDQNPHRYEMYYAKKNGQPKTDYPPLFEEQVLCQTGIVNISLCEKNNDVFLEESDEEMANSSSAIDKFESYSVVDGEVAQIAHETSYYESHIGNAPFGKNNTKSFAKTTFASMIDEAPQLNTQRKRRDREDDVKMGGFCFCFSWFFKNKKKTNNNDKKSDSGLKDPLIQGIAQNQTQKMQD